MKDEVCTETIASDQRPPVSKSNSGSEQLAKVAESSEEDSELLIVLIWNFFQIFQLIAIEMTSKQVQNFSNPIPMSYQI